MTAASPIVIIVPGEPVPKARARVPHGGHAFTPQRTKDYETHIGECSLGPRLAAVVTGRWPDAAHEWSVVVRVFEEPRATAHRGDLDNYEKIVLDALQGIIWENDVQIRAMTSSIVRDAVTPSIVIELWRSET